MPRLERDPGKVSHPGGNGQRENGKRFRYGEHGSLENREHTENVWKIFLGIFFWGDDSSESGSSDLVFFVWGGVCVQQKIGWISLHPFKPYALAGYLATLTQDICFL